MVLLIQNYGTGRGAKEWLMIADLPDIDLQITEVYSLSFLGKYKLKLTVIYQLVWVLWIFNL